MALRSGVTHRAALAILTSFEHPFLFSILFDIFALAFEPVLEVLGCVAPCGKLMSPRQPTQAIVTAEW